jgi:uncharacterized protein (DUF427 family)
MAEIRLERSFKRVRGYLAGQELFDTTGALLVWEIPYYPAYYVPIDDVAVELVGNGRTKESETRGRGKLLDVQIGGVVHEDVALRYADSPIEELRDVVRFEWDALDQWLEEDEPVYVHPRDPYTRIDVLSSSRHVEVVVEGEKVASSSKPTILFETGLPPRYYLPMSDVRMELLEPSSMKTHCPYKGTATYWNINVGGKSLKDFVWTYRTPLPESQKIAGLVAFYNENVDLYVDGELQERPRTKFSDG